MDEPRLPLRSENRSIPTSACFPHPNDTLLNTYAYKKSLNLSIALDFEKGVKFER